MNKLFYWQEWQKPYRYTFWVLFVFFIGLAITVLVLHGIGPERLIAWDVLSKSAMFTDDFMVFSKGPFSFSLTGYKSIIQEIFSGGSLPATFGFTKFLIVITGLGMVLYLSLVTLFKRFWYLVAMGGFLGFLILFHIETLELFGWTDFKILVLVFAVLLTPSYYLHAFRTTAGFGFRVLVMTLALLLLVILIYLFSPLKEPFVTLLSFGILAPYLLILLFVFSVAHEIIAAFIALVTGTKGIGDATKLRHFTVISLVYLVNILLSYLYISHYIDWQLFYISPFLILVISAILGIWGSRNRASMYAGAGGDKAVWPILYLVIGIISLATLTFFFLTLNDPFIKVIGDIIIYTHLIIGIMFLLYIMYNFIPLIERGMNVHKVLYNPQNFPFFTFKLLSVMSVIALFSIKGFDYPIWYSMGGYNNVKADLALANGNLDVAKAYYANADAFAYHNHKANYTLGLLFSADDPDKSMEHFENAIDQQPTAQTVINLANLKNLQQDYYGGLFGLQKGYAKLGDNKYLINNLALQFEKLRLLDSASYYFAKPGVSSPQLRNNRLAFSARYAYPLAADSLSVLQDLNTIGRANAAALGIASSLPDIDNADNMYDMVLLNNWLLSNRPQVTDSSLYQARAIVDNTTDKQYQEQLLYNWSLAAFRSGDVSAAINGLLNLAFNSTEWSDVAYMALAKLYIQLESYDQAVGLLTNLNKPALQFDLAVAQLENGDFENAKSFWQQAAKSGDEFLAATAEELLNTVYTESPALTTPRKAYLYARYNRQYIDESSENQLLQIIDSDYLRIGLALDLAAYYYQMENNNAALQMLKNIEALSLTKEQYRNYLVMDMLLHQNDADYVQENLVTYDSLYGFSPSDYLLEYTFNHMAGLTLDSLAYLQMATNNPFNEDAVLIGAEFFINDKNSFRSYEMLARAVQKNPGSQRLLKAYILKALDVGLDQFAENALFEYSQRFSGQAYLTMKLAYDRKREELSKLVEAEPID